MKITNLFSCLIFLCILCFSSILKSQCNTVSIYAQNIGASTAGNPIVVCAGQTVSVMGTLTGGFLAIQFYQGGNLIQTNTFTSLPGTLVVPAIGTYQLSSNMGANTCSTGHLEATTPVNDLIGNALDIDCLDGPFAGTTTCATDTDYPGTCSTNVNHAPGVWYKIQGTDADITLDLCTALNYDSQISVWSGSPGNLNCVAGNDNSCGFGSEVTFSSVAGTTYYVYVFGHTNDPTDAFTLTVTCDCTTTVINTNDAGHGSLRGAVQCANSGDVITFDPTIDMQSIEPTAEITINKDLTLVGNGVDKTIIDGAQGDSRLFLVSAGNTAHFEKMTFQNGGSTIFNGAGGVLLTNGSTSILNCEFSNNNTTSDVGKAIVQYEGDLKIVNCGFSQNGLLASSGALIWVQGSTSTTYISQSTFTGNDVGSLIIEGCASFDFRNNTVDGNTLGTKILQVSGPLQEIHNNVLNDNIDPIVGGSSATTNATHNISYMSDALLPVADGNFVGDALLNTDLSLMSISPAIASGNNSEISADILDVDDDGNTTEDLPQDYIGGARVQGCSSNVDIGAYEANDSGTGVVSNTRDDGYGSLRYEIECAAPGATITFDPAINTQLIQLTSGQITIDKDLTIQGNGIINTIIDGALDDNSRLLVVNPGKTVHIEGMTLQNGGSATYASSGAGLYTSGNTSILNCKFSNNNNVSIGNAINQFTGDLKVVNTEFSNNGLLGSGGNECVIWKQGTNSTAQFNQCTFWGNNVDFTEILSFDGVSFDFSQNSMSNTNNQNLIRLIGVGTNTVHNNVLNSTADLMILSNGATATTSNNLLEHTDADLPAADGNFVGDPMFVDAAAGDLNLMSGSVAISAGDDMSIPADILDVDNDGDITEALPTDYNGNTRVHACIVDIGAIEYQGNDMPIVVTNTNNDGPGSFRQALACAPSGSTITFDPITNGTPIVLLTGSLSPANDNITIKGNGTGQTILDGGDSDITLFNLDSKMLIVEDLTVQKFGTTFKRLFIIDNGSFFRFYNSEVDDCGLSFFLHGIIFCDGSTVELENSTFSNIVGRAPYEFDSNSTNCVVKQCLFFNHTNNNFELFGTKTGSSATFIQNTFSNITTGNNNHGIIKFEEGGSIEVSNNIFYGNTTFNDVINDGTGGMLIAGANISEFPGDLPMGSYISVDPLFVDAAADNYKLSACSPAIGRGDAARAPATDTEGHARPTGFGVDIGWDERTGPTCTDGECSTPILIDCGSTIMADNYNGANNEFDYSNCNGSILDGPERIYEITTTDVGDIIVSIISSGNIDLSLMLTDDCGNPLSCVSTSGSGGTMSIASAAVGTYYIILDGQAGATGDMEFTVDATCGHVPCTENIVMINAPEDPMGLYHAIDEIQSDATINNDATYKAGNHIDLNEGFEVTTGQVFEAIIEPCPN